MQYKLSQQANSLHAHAQLHIRVGKVVSTKHLLYILNTLKVPITHFSDEEAVWILILHRDSMPLNEYAYHLIGSGSLSQGQCFEVDLRVEHTHFHLN